MPLLTHHMAGIPVSQIKTYPDQETLKTLADEVRPTLCFLDVATNPDRALELVDEILAIASGIHIVILMNTNAPDLVLRFLRRGASEFLIQPFQPEDLKPVLTRLSQISPTIRYGTGAKVIGVVPAKGACGASTIASNLAYQRKRLGSKRMLLADLDLLSGTIPFLMKLKSNYSVLDALSRSTALDEDLWRGMVVIQDGLEVLLSPDNPMDGMQDLPDPTPVVEFARQLYDVVVLDCPTVYGKWGLALATVCDDLLLVTTNELPTLQATQRVLVYLERNRVEQSKIRLIVNRYSRDVGLSKDAIATALHRDVHHLIPSDYESVQRALVEGRPLPSSTAFGKSLIALADRLAGNKPVPEEKKKKAKSSLTGMFSSIFSRQ